MRALHLVVIGALLAIPSVAYSQADGPVGGKVGTKSGVALDHATRLFPLDAAKWAPARGRRRNAPVTRAPCRPGKSCRMTRP